MPPRTRHLYVARDRQDPSRVKVGISEEPAHRLDNLERQERTTLHLLGVIPTANYDDERRLHATLAPWRIAGEWYRAEVVPFLTRLYDHDLTSLVEARRRPRTL